MARITLALLASSTLAASAPLPSPFESSKSSGESSSLQRRKLGTPETAKEIETLIKGDMDIPRPLETELSLAVWNKDFKVNEGALRGFKFPFFGGKRKESELLRVAV